MILIVYCYAKAAKERRTVVYVVARYSVGSFDLRNR